MREICKVIVVKLFCFGFKLQRMKSLIEQLERLANSGADADDLDRDEVELTLGEDDRATEDAAENVADDDASDHTLRSSEAAKRTDDGRSVRAGSIIKADVIKAANSSAEPPPPPPAPPSSSSTSPAKRKTNQSSQDLPEYFIRLQCPHCNQRSVTFRVGDRHNWTVDEIK